MARIKRGGKRVMAGEESSPVKSAVVSFVRDLEVGEPVDYKNLSVFPVYRDIGAAAVKDVKLITLTEAIKKNIVDVIDIGEVSKLKIHNKSKDTKILIVEGEVVRGGAQDRVVNVTLILNEKSETVIPVSCVEQNRWEGFDQTFKVHDAYVTPSMYKGIYESVSCSAKISGGGTYCANQSMIWEAADRELHEVGVESVTRSIGDAYQAKQGDIDDILKKIMVVLDKDIVGVVVVIDGKGVYGDISDSKEIAEVQVPKALRSYIFDALVSKESKEVNIGPTRICLVLNAIEWASFDVNKSVGEGLDVRFSIGDTKGSAVVYKEEVVHMTLLAVL